MSERISKDDFWRAARVMIDNFPHTAKNLAKEIIDVKGEKGIRAKFFSCLAYRKIMKSQNTFNMACMAGATFGHKHEPKDLLLGLSGLKKLEAR